MKLFDSFDKSVDPLLKSILDKPVLIKALVHLLLVLYIAKLAPTPPAVILELFENVYFKLFIFSLVLWTAQFTPSISILIALAFMVTINYSTTGKLWEMMENIEAASVADSSTEANAIDAVKMLAAAAASPEASSPVVIAPIANVAAAGATTVEGVEAIKALAEQAIKPASGNEENIVNASLSAIDSISPEPTIEPEPTPALALAPAQEVNPSEPTPVVSGEAVKILADAALSPTASSPEAIATLANVAVASASTIDGVNAIKDLVEQAIVPEAGDKALVENAKEIALESINKNVIAGPTETVPVSIEEGVKAITALANGASSEEALNVNDVNTVAQIAAANSKSDEGVKAIKELAIQAIMADAGNKDKIVEAANIAINSVVPAEPVGKPELAVVEPSDVPVAPSAMSQPAGCYPIRKYDMSKVAPSYDQQSAEDYKEFVPSPESK